MLALSPAALSRLRAEVPLGSALPSESPANASAPPRYTLSRPSLQVLGVWQQRNIQYFPGLWPGHL